MTHAFLNPKRVKPHGKEFQQKIQEINKVLSLNITTTHQYVTWYRCDGICREYEDCLFGYVSRVANPTITHQVSTRKHQLTCGGSLKETEKPGREVILAISKRYKLIKSKLKKKKPYVDNKHPPIFRHNRPLASKIIEYQTTDDEA